MNEFEIIQEELKQYSWKTIREFNNLFFCSSNESQVYPVIEICPKECYIGSELGEYYYYYMEYLAIESPEKFWNNWNRFKKLKAFL